MLIPDGADWVLTLNRAGRWRGTGPLMKRWVFGHPKEYRLPDNHANAESLGHPTVNRRVRPELPFDDLVPILPAPDAIAGLLVPHPERS